MPKETFVSRFSGFASILSLSPPTIRGLVVKTLDPLDNEVRHMHCLYVSQEVPPSFF